MFSENIISLTCCTIIKMPVSRVGNSVQEGPIQFCHEDKNMVEQSSTVPQSISMVSCISQYQAWGPSLVGERHKEETTPLETNVEDEEQEEDRFQISVFNIIFKF